MKKPLAMARDGVRKVMGLWFTLVMFAGCSGTGPVPVEGVVTFDSKPLEGATVMFRPAQGRPSVGKTDAAGRYRLRYTSERDGAVPGTHVVSITTLDDSGDTGPTTKEPIPAKYNSASELSVTVGSGQTSHNFDLQSK